MKWFYCDSNLLTSLDVSKNTALKLLSCFSNQIKGKGMDALIESLPLVENGEMYIIYKNEGNVMTTTQVAAAKAKGWIPKYRMDSYDWKDYAGSDPAYDASGDAASIVKGDDFSGEVVIPENIEINGKILAVTSIGDGAFKNNTKITSVTLPESVTSIGDYAFEGCSNLTIIIIGKSVTHIGTRAFGNITPTSQTRGNNGLKISCYAESVPNTAADAFENTPISSATLLVNDNLVTAYKTTAPWSSFGTIMGFDEASGINGVLIENGGKAKIFSIDGKPLSRLQKGINIIRMDDGTTKKVVVQ
ncbi:Leucine rich repeat-containing protein [Xylanibacter ruminicola]|uniref:Leucine rich repeat-containing protein n=1 Tax=Xylanibacter ruminicola TaxID=839 RepID=A0A1M6RLR6_XYLRU|nr:Leucine rich repeat-containing protein [Xylanibacter ruminicola]